MEATRIYLGKLTEDESSFIEPMIERLAGLEELLIIANNLDISSKINIEIKDLNIQCEDWFKKISSLKNWEYHQEDWEIDFIKKDVWLIPREVKE